MRVVRSGVTRTVFVGRRWAVKVPKIYREDSVHSQLGWLVRGWLANRSEWRQRDRPDVCAPLLTLGHVALVFPSASLVGTDFDGMPPMDSWPWPWRILDDVDEHYSEAHDVCRDEHKPSSWGWFETCWLLIDYDRAWRQEDRGLVGRLYYGWQERQARRW